jgi:hypothetical protein
VLEKESSFDSEPICQKSECLHEKSFGNAEINKIGKRNERMKIILLEKIATYEMPLSYGPKNWQIIPDR